MGRREGVGAVKKRLLLQACCAPCATVAIERLLNDYEVEVFFWGSNIYPREEHDRRLCALRELCTRVGVPLVEVSYGPDEFRHAVRGLEAEHEGGARCGRCFEMRLEAAAEAARERGCEFFTSTLSSSPHKDARVINEIGNRVAQKFPAIRYLDVNFRDGFSRSVELCKQFGLYRQKYCGCEFSVR